MISFQDDGRRIPGPNLSRGVDELLDSGWDGSPNRGLNDFLYAIQRIGEKAFIPTDAPPLWRTAYCLFQMTGGACSLEEHSGGEILFDLVRKYVEEPAGKLVWRDAVALLEGTLALGGRETGPIGILIDRLVGGAAHLSLSDMARVLNAAANAGINRRDLATELAIGFAYERHQSGGMNIGAFCSAFQAFGKWRFLPREFEILATEMLKRGDKFETLSAVQLIQLGSAIVNTGVQLPHDSPVFGGLRRLGAYNVSAAGLYLSLAWLTGNIAGCRNFLGESKTTLQIPVSLSDEVFDLHCVSIAVVGEPFRGVPKQCGSSFACSENDRSRNARQLNCAVQLLNRQTTKKIQFSDVAPSNSLGMAQHQLTTGDRRFLLRVSPPTDFLNRSVGLGLVPRLRLIQEACVLQLGADLVCVPSELISYGSAEQVANCIQRAISGGHTDTRMKIFSMPLPADAALGKNSLRFRYVNVSALVEEAKKAWDSGNFGGAKLLLAAVAEGPYAPHAFSKIDANDPDVGYALKLCLQGLRTTVYAFLKVKEFQLAEDLILRCRENYQHVIGASGLGVLGNLAALVAFRSGDFESAEKRTQAAAAHWEQACASSGVPFLAPEFFKTRTALLLAFSELRNESLKMSRDELLCLVASTIQKASILLGSEERPILLADWIKSVTVLVNLEMKSLDSGTSPQRIEGISRLIHLMTTIAPDQSIANADYSVRVSADLRVQLVTWLLDNSRNEEALASLRDTIQFARELAQLYDERGEKEMKGYLRAIQKQIRTLVTNRGLADVVTFPKL